MKKLTISNKVIDRVFDMTIGCGYDGPLMGHHVKRLEDVNGREFTQQELRELGRVWSDNCSMMAQP